MPFEIELALEGVVDRLDQLPERVGADPRPPVGFAGERWPHEVSASLVEERLELGAGVSLVGDEDLAGTVNQQAGFEFEHVPGNLTLVGG